MSYTQLLEKPHHEECFCFDVDTTCIRSCRNCYKRMEINIKASSEERDAAGRVGPMNNERWQFLGSSWHVKVQ